MSDRKERSYSPFSIRYTFAQCTWLLANLKDLRAGIYPSDPEPTGYTDPRIFNRSGEYKAFTENIGTVIGTLERWLLETGRDGAAAVLRYGLDYSYREIGKLLNINKDQAYAGAIRAIKYCVYQGEKLPKR